MGDLARSSRAVTGERRWPGATVWIVIGVGVLVGVVAEAASYGLADPGSWVPDLLVGWVCIGCGALVAFLQPGSRIALILAGAGFAWFIGNFSGLPVAVLAAVAAQLTLTHRAVLMHAALTVPSGRIVGRVQLGIVVIAYVAWSVPATADIPIAAAALCALVVVAAVVELLTAAPPARRVRVVGLAAAVLLGGAFTLASVVHAAVPSGEGDQIVLLIDQAMIVVVTVGLTVATLLPGLRVGHVTDLVVQASRARSGVVRESLAVALGDPSLEIGYWHPASGRYLDASGETVSLPSETDPRTVLRVDLDDRPAAVLVHNPAALESSALTDAVRTTTVLASANARLRSDVLDQLVEVRASRRRLLLAADAELSRLERRVDKGPLQRSRELAASLERVESAVESRGATSVAKSVGRAHRSLMQATDDLEALARGLHPAAVGADGLAAALRALAARSPLPVEVTYKAGVLPEPIALALYYACAEAITNVVKHADASAARVRVWVDESRVHLLVTDDGVGGADPGAGSGLRGIADRVETLDGTVRLTSQAGSGTRLVVQIPLWLEGR